MRRSRIVQTLNAEEAFLGSGKRWRGFSVRQDPSQRANGSHEVRYVPPRSSSLAAALLDGISEHPEG